MNKNQETVISMVIIQLNNENMEIPEESKVKQLIDCFAQFNPLNDDEKNEVKKEVFSRLNVRMDLGSIIKTDYRPWYMNAKANIDDRYWNRYRQYLLSKKGFAPDSVNSIDKATDRMLDLFGNPNEEQEFSRRGLVIGDVQSGKTSTYTALINKAADAGYRVIILLTGTIEKLRQQTQSRLDEGFVGFSSYDILNNKAKVCIGVGEYDGSINAVCLTSTANDFNAKVANTINLKISSLNEPVIFVVKKNKSVLEKLEKWLTTLNNSSGKIYHPMLLIDDEADNASVNTKKLDEDPTTINKCIRKLLNVFTRSTYVAFTATPYANIFINPDNDDEMLKDDLFPRDFIYALDAPTNYIGASEIFSEIGNHHYMLHNNDDCEDFVPEKHKKDFEPGNLPVSLREALCSFFIANAIRDLRGEGFSHRSMLINISRFIDVQERIAEEVEDFVRNYKMIYKNYGNLGELAESHPEIVFTRKIYEKYFLYLNVTDKGDMFTWLEVEKQLSKSCAPILVRTVNGTNSKLNLNYENNSEFGLRIIAVGGFSLSRGLTLEGLSTSYFYRNSKMYDTLMQMGRWFGYRKGYADLCQVWMSEKSADWYEYISEAQEELKHEVKRMMNANGTPKDFGLGVRSDINSLLVTAVNKMRSAEDYERTISLSGTVVETKYIDLDEKTNSKNNEIIYYWLNKIFENGYKTTEVKEIDGIPEPLDQKKHVQILSVDSEYIIDLLQKVNVNRNNFDFQTDSIVGMINNDKHKLFSHWDIIIADNNRDNPPQKICEDISLGPINRSFIINKELKYIQMSGSKSRLGSVNYAKGGLTKNEVKTIEERAKISRSSTENKTNFNQNDYFNVGFRRNPLLIIYPVSLSKNKKSIDCPELIESYKELIFGLAVGFPSIAGEEKITYKYKVNSVRWKEIMGIDSFDDDYDEEIVDEND